MELNKISSFKSFSEMRNQETAIKTEQENKVKRVKSLEKISAILDELQISDMSELDEEKKKALYAKLFSEDRQEEIEDDIVKLGKETDLTKKVGAIAGKSTADEVEEDRSEDIEDDINKIGEPKNIDEANVTLDAMEPDEKGLVAFCKKKGIKWKIINMNGPAGGWPEVEYVGKKKDLEQMIKNFWEGDGEDSGLAEFIEEGVLTVAFDPINGEYIFEARSETKVFKLLQKIFAGAPLLTKDKAQHVAIVDGLYMDAMEDANFYNEAKDASFAAFQSFFNAYGKAITVDVPGLSGTTVSIGKKEIEAWQGKWTSDISSAGQWNGYDITLGFRKYLESIGEPNVGLTLDTAFGKANESATVKVDEARSINKIQNDFTKIINQMKNTAELWKQSQGDEKAAILNTLKDLTAQKKKLEAELDDAITDKDKDLELVVTEGNAFTGALFAARNKGEKTFEFNGKTYKVAGAKKVNEDDEEVKEGNAFGDAVTKAKEAGEKEFEFDGKTYKVEEGNAFGDAVRKAKESGEKEFEFDGKTYKVEEAEIQEGNAFGDAVRKAKEAGEKEFEFDGKKYKVEESKHNPSIKIVKEQINEAKQFDKDLDSMIKDIKRGMGWIDPEYVGDSWENSSDAIDFSIVKAEVFKKLLDAGVLYFSDDSGEEKGKAVKLADLGAIINMYESKVNEAEKFKSTQDFEEFLEEIDGMPEVRIKKIMGKDYIDTPGGYRDEAEDYDNDIVEYMISNMGKSDFEELKNWWESNVAESVVTEAEVKSDEEFKEYAFSVLKKAFGADFDEAKAGEVVDGILKKCGDDYGACVGTLTSSLAESVTNEGIDVEYWADYNTDTSGQADKSFADKSTNFDSTWKLAVSDWNDNNDMGEENEITPAMAKKVEKIAKEFFKKAGWISVNVAGAMIAQES